jgi:hypothetical protein
LRYSTNGWYADDLLGHLSTEDALARMQSVNQPGRSSAEVQATFGDFVRGLGFESEKVGLFGLDELAPRVATEPDEVAAG